MKTVDVKTVSQEDERVYIRHPAEIPIGVKSHHPAEHQSSPLQNISKGGLAFMSQTPLTPGSLVEISIRIVRPAFHGLGLIVWCRQQEDQWEVGAQFVNEGDAFRLRMIEQICHIAQYKRDIARLEGRRLSSENAAREWIEKHAARFPNPCLSSAAPQSASGGHQPFPSAKHPSSQTSPN